MTEEEKMFNRMLEFFKQNISCKDTVTVLECAQLINVSKEKIRELINKPNTDFPYFKIGSKVLINRKMLTEWLEKVSIEHRNL